MKDSRPALSLFTGGLLTLVVFIALPGFGQSRYAQPDTYAGLIAESETYFEDKLKTDKIVGLSAAIIMDGKVIWKKGFGYADQQTKTPMTVNTVVNIGSVTKTFTALSVMQLEERGLLDIQKPLTTYLPTFHPLTRPGIPLDSVTVKTLITHTSGIQSDVWKNSDLGSGHYTDVLGFINQTHLVYPAGLAGLYSNAGYNILGHLIRDVTQTDYVQYVHKHIFTVLGMTHSGFAMDGLTNRTKIYAYGQQANEYELRDIASGGIYTDMNDFTTYALGMLQAYRGESTALLKQATAQKMFTQQNAQVPLETNKKGLGWFMFRNDSTFAMYHAGSAGFTHAKLLLIPDRNAALLVLTNTAEGGQAAETFCFNELPRFGLRIPDLFPTPTTHLVGKPQDLVTLADSTLTSYVGIYAESNSYNVVKLTNHQLILVNGGQKLVLKPVSETEFLPYDVKGADTIPRVEQRLIFRKLKGKTFLFRRVNTRDYNLGYWLRPIDPHIWSNRMGIYEHYGYQLMIGDSKFKRAELYMSADSVLMLRLSTMGSSSEMPLDAIDANYALSSGVNSGFGGVNVIFREAPLYQTLEFAGLSFRKPH
ncbi:serine hydrolase domain-containing protein [Spirosoma pollinicola]|nr:serine hydrolase domain-containing protein [Spirosoma pollinicola]